MPKQPWEYVVNGDERQEDGMITYTVFCEDGEHEPTYIESFQQDRVLKIIAIRNQGQGRINFLNTMQRCVQNGNAVFENGGYKLVAGINKNIWCVFDRDVNINQPNVKADEDLSFTLAISHAIATGIKVAWSNDAFELWVLLHFERVPYQVIYRDYIYNRLTEIFKVLEEPTEALTSLLVRPDFSYERTLKRRPNFEQVVMPLLKQRSVVAIENAKLLEAHHADNIPFHDRNPCTMVHHLVQEILAITQAQE